MTDERPSPEREKGPPADSSSEDIDPGEPIRELAVLREDAPPAFWARIRNQLQRRLMVSQMADLSMPMFCRLFVEYLSMVFAAFGATEERQKRK